MKDKEICFQILLFVLLSFNYGFCASLLPLDYMYQIILYVEDKPFIVDVIFVLFCFYTPNYDQRMCILNVVIKCLSGHFKP